MVYGCFWIDGSPVCMAYPLGLKVWLPLTGAFIWGKYGVLVNRRYGWAVWNGYYRLILLHRESMAVRW